MEIIPKPSALVTLPPLLTPEELVANSSGKIKANDPRIEHVLEGASASVRRRCRWHVTPVIKETITVNLDGASHVFLPTMHVIDIHEVKLFGVELDPGHYGWSSTGLLELFVYDIPKRFRALEVTLTHGFHEAPDLSAIASKIALFSLASPLGVTREQAGQMSVSFGTQRGMGFADRDLIIIDTYRVQPEP